MYFPRLCTRRFLTQYTSDTVATLLKDTILHRDLAKYVSCISFDNAFDMVSWMGKLDQELQLDIPGVYCRQDRFHILRTAHIISLSVKEFMTTIPANLAKIRGLLNNIRCSIKHREVCRNFTKNSRCMGSYRILIERQGDQLHSILLKNRLQWGRF